jgi:hypothetical protein
VTLRLGKGFSDLAATKVTIYSCRIIKPPIGKSEIIGNLARLLQDDSVWLERRIDITSHASGVVSHGHRCTANDEHVPYDARRAKRSRAP